MDIGIGLPATIPGLTREELLDWARRADEAGFSSLATIDRLVYDNHEPLELLVGGAADVTFRGAARYGDGWTMGGGAPEQFAAGAEKLRAAWSEAGREGEPRTVALAYFGLGPNAEESAREDLGHYYSSFLGDEVAGQIVASAATDEETVRSYVQGFAEAGADEFVLFPVDTDPGQVDLLAEVALGGAQRDRRSREHRTTDSASVHR